MNRLIDRRFQRLVVTISPFVAMILVGATATAQPRTATITQAEILVTVVNVKGEPVSDSQVRDFLKGKPTVFTVVHPRADKRGVSRVEALKRGTEALGINDQGAVVGDFIDTSGVTRAYVLESVKDPRSIHDIEILGATFTRAYAINNNGLIVGIFRGRDGITKGFRVTLEEAKKANNKPIRLTRENTIEIGGRNTQALGVNDMGTVVGGFTADNGVIRAFQQKTGQAPEEIKFEPKTADGKPPRFVSAFDITNDGVILGNYGEVTERTGFYLHSRTFLLSTNGRQVADFDVGFPVTNAGMGINNNLEMVGLCGPGTGCGGNVSWYQMVSNPDPTKTGTAAELTSNRALLRMADRVSTALAKINGSGGFVGTTDSPSGALVGLVGSMR